MADTVSAYPDDQAILLRDHLPGWEQAWQALAAELVRMVPIMSRRFGFRFDDDGARDEFASFVIDHYERRAQEGRLLASWGEPKPGIRRASAIGFLLGHFCLLGLLEKWQSRRVLPRAAPLADSDAVDTAAGLRACDWPEPVDIDGLDRLRFAFTANAMPITNPVLVAGLQLHPRMDWGSSPAPAIRRSLPELALGVPADHLATVLADRHSRLRQEHRATLESLNRRVEEAVQTGNVRQAGTLNRLLKKACQTYVIHPLGGSALADLLGSNPNHADQLNRRYRLGFTDKNWVRPALTEEDPS